MVSTRPHISKSSSFCTTPLVTVRSAPITIGITVTFLFHSFFFSFLERSRYLSVNSLSFIFTLWSARTAKSTLQQVLVFLVNITRSCRLTEIRCSVCISKPLRGFIITIIIIIIIILLLLLLFYSFESFSDQVFRTLLSILTDLSNAVVWFPVVLMSKSSSSSIILW